MSKPNSTVDSTLILCLGLMIWFLPSPGLLFLEPPLSSQDYLELFTPSNDHFIDAYINLLDAGGGTENMAPSAKNPGFKCQLGVRLSLSSCPSLEGPALSSTAPGDSEQ